MRLWDAETESLAIVQPKSAGATLSGGAATMGRPARGWLLASPGARQRPTAEVIDDLQHDDVDAFFRVKSALMSESGITGRPEV